MTHSIDDRQQTSDSGLTEIVSKKRAEMVREKLYQELEAATLRWSWFQKRSKDWQPWHDTDSFMKQWGMP
jgi:hypothetical protein